MKFRVKFSPPNEEASFLQYSLSDSKSENDVTELTSSESEEIPYKTSTSAVDLREFETGIYGRSFTVNYVHYDSTNLYFCRPSGCRPTKGQCAGPTCFPRCCPCYNKHFRCCLPACINKVRNICIMPRKIYPCADDVEEFIPTPKRRRRKSKKKEEEPSEPMVEEATSVVEDLVECAVEEVQAEPEKMDSATDIDEAYFCAGQAFATQTGITAEDIENLGLSESIEPDRLTAILSRASGSQKGSEDDTSLAKPEKCKALPGPPPVPCIKVLLKNAFDAVCSNAITRAEYTRRGPGCNKKHMCLCTLPYKQRQQVHDSSNKPAFDKFGNKIKFTQGQDNVKCPCVGEHCVGSCGYRKSKLEGEPSMVPLRAEPCISECNFHVKGRNILNDMEDENSSVRFEQSAQEHIMNLLRL